MADRAVIDAVDEGVHSSVNLHPPDVASNIEWGPDDDDQMPPLVPASPPPSRAVSRAASRRASLPPPPPKKPMRSILRKMGHQRPKSDFVSGSGRRGPPTSAAAAAAQSDGSDVEEDDFNLLINPDKMKPPDEVVAEEDREYLEEKSRDRDRSSSGNRDRDRNHGRRNHGDRDRDRAPSRFADEDEEGGDDEFDEDELPDEEEYDDDEEDEFDEDGAPPPPQRPRPQSPPRLTTTEVANRKAKVLFRLKRRCEFLGAKIEYDASMSLEMLETLEAQHRHEANATSTVELMRQIFVFVTGMTEAMSPTFKFLGLDLRGFSTHMYLRIRRYDEVLFDLYDEHCDSMPANPMWRLITMYIMDMMSYSTADALNGAVPAVRVAAQQQPPQPLPQAQPAAAAPQAGPPAPVEEPDADEESSKLLAMMREEEAAANIVAQAAAQPNEVEVKVPPNNSGKRKGRVVRITG